MQSFKQAFEISAKKVKSNHLYNTVQNFPFLFFFLIHFLKKLTGAEGSIESEASAYSGDDKICEKPEVLNFRLLM